MQTSKAVNSVNILKSHKSIMVSRKVFLKALDCGIDQYDFEYPEQDVRLFVKSDIIGYLEVLKNDKIRFSLLCSSVTD